jgi:hypothetical protein
MDPIADIKQLFDIQRAEKLHSSVSKILKLVTIFFFSVICF